MGCGGSKLEGDDDTVPSGLRPFRRRFDEIRQRRSGHAITKEGALSSKQLLYDEGEDHGDHHVPTDNSYSEIRKRVSSPPEKAQKENLGLATQVHDHGRTSTSENEQNKIDHHPMDAPDSEMRMSVSSAPENEIVGLDKEKSTMKNDATTEVPHQCPPSTPENHQNNVESDKSDEVMKYREEDNSSGCDEKERDGDGEGEGREIGPESPCFSREGSFLQEEGREIGPASPSFREFFVSAAAAESDAGNGEDRSSGVKKEDKPSRIKDISSGSSEKSEDKLVKKESRGRKLRNVLPKGKQGTGKNFWNVGSCYHPSTSSVQGKGDA